MAPVHHEGRDGRDVLRGALADLRKVRTDGVVPLPRSQTRTVAVPWTSRTRLFDSIGVSVPSTGSGFSTLPLRTVARLSRRSCFIVNDLLNGVFDMVCNTKLVFIPIGLSY